MDFWKRIYLWGFGIIYIFEGEKWMFYFNMLFVIYFVEQIPPIQAWVLSFITVKALYSKKAAAIWKGDFKDPTWLPCNALLRQVKCMEVILVAEKHDWMWFIQPLIQRQGNISGPHSPFPLHCGFPATFTPCKWAHSANLFWVRGTQWHSRTARWIISIHKLAHVQISLAAH